MLGEIDAGGFAGSLNLTAGVRGGSINELSKWRSGEEDTSDCDCFSAARPLLGLRSWDEDRIRAISSSARPRLILGLSAVMSGSAGFAKGRFAEESKEEK